MQNKKQCETERNVTDGVRDTSIDSRRQRSPNDETDAYTVFVHNMVEQKILVLMDRFCDKPKDLVISEVNKLIALDQKNVSPEDFLMSFIRDAGITDGADEIPKKHVIDENSKFNDDVFLTSFEVRELTGQALNTIKNWVRSSKYVGYMDKDKFVLPAWQFKGTKPLPGLREVLVTIGNSGLDACEKITLPLDAFDDESILTLLRLKRLDDALLAAKELTDVDY